MRKKKLTMKLLRVRLDPELKIEEIALKAGVTSGTVRNWESGRSRPKLYPEQMQALLDLYQCSLSELIEASGGITHE